MAAKVPATDASKQTESVEGHRNELVLVGRLAAAAEERTLPSGDVLVTWRLVVDRPPQTRPDARRAPTVDAIDCVTWRATVRRSVLSWNPGDTIELTGALRRRFWRSERGAVSRTEVEVGQVRRLAKAG
jgi:single-strand DNA-binding protein